MSDDRFWVQFRACAMVKNAQWRVTSSILDNAGIPEEFRRAKLDLIPSNLPHHAELKKVRSRLYRDVPKGRGLILYGGASTGKTSAAVALLISAIKRGAQVYFFDCGNLVDVANRRDKPNRATTNEDIPVWDMLCKRQLVLLDDVGAEQAKIYGEGSGLFVERIVRARSNAMLPTIITTNYDLEKLADTYSPIRARLFSKRKFRFVSVAGKLWP